MVRAWFMDSEETDQRLEHQLNPPQFVELNELYQTTGVEYFKVKQLFCLRVLIIKMKNSVTLILIQFGRRSRT